MDKKVLVVVGTRPNFIKITQFRRVFAGCENIEFKLLHTGQHFDENMSKVFFKELGIQDPDYQFKLESRDPSAQIGEIMMGLSNVFQKWKPDLVLVVGDVNSTLAAGIAAQKAGIKIGHIESGLRSGDRTMPEEINRILTDEITDYYFVTEPSGLKHLVEEGREQKDIFYVGNTMIDSLVANKDKIAQSKILKDIGVQSKDYILCTLHRPALVDEEVNLKRILNLFYDISRRKSVVFPIHPRTRNQFEKYGLLGELQALRKVYLIPPIGYLDFQHLVANSSVILTDSGGIQEESTYLQIPCLTVRPNTERPVTIEEGSNELLEFDEGLILDKIDQIVEGKYKKGNIPELWDGKATERIVEMIKRMKD